MHYLRSPVWVRAVSCCTPWFSATAVCPRRRTRTALRHRQSDGAFPASRRDAHAPDDMRDDSVDCVRDPGAVLSLTKPATYETHAGGCPCPVVTFPPLRFGALLGVAVDRRPVVRVGSPTSATQPGLIAVAIRPHDELACPSGIARTPRAGHQLSTAVIHTMHGMTLVSFVAPGCPAPRHTRRRVRSRRMERTASPDTPISRPGVRRSCPGMQGADGHHLLGDQLRPGAGLPAAVKKSVAAVDVRREKPGRSARHWS
jgi:hypothetical protein